MRKTAVLNAVGLSPSLLSPEHAPRLHAFRRSNRLATIGPVLPAVTTTVQSTYLTGRHPGGAERGGGHGAVANGWYFRDTAEVRFWLQSNHLVAGDKVWDRAKQLDPAFTCANLFWWYNMYSSADVSVTPRPMYPADGRKIPDCYTHPPQLRDELQSKLGAFPLFNFWGPATDICATTWIADATIEIDKKHDATLTLAYLPHMDYVLQKEGPAGPNVGRDLRQLDAECGKLIDHFQSRGARVIVLSEYGITAVSKPVHLNLVLREAGLLAVREELGREILDAGASRAFAVADHQLAHIYVNDRARLNDVARLLANTPGVAAVLDPSAQRAHHLDHPRSGDLVCLADSGAWFTYYFWLDDARAPDYARTVDIHRKPGYDPVELFLDPKLAAPKARIAWKLAKRKIGFRTLLDVIPLDATLVKGSHGLAAASPEQAPILISSEPALIPSDSVPATEIHDLILRHLTA
jgi:predicted AlkP superfamily pyrophosphatase or phosphodiesterase